MGAFRGHLIPPPRYDLSVLTFGITQPKEGLFAF